MVWKETAFLFAEPWKGVDECSECCLPGVFCDSGDTPANLLCELNGHLMPCTRSLYGKWVEDVCAGQFGYLSILFCAVLSAAAPGLVAVLPMWDSAYDYD